VGKIAKKPVWSAFLVNSALKIQCHCKKIQTVFSAILPTGISFIQIHIGMQDMQVECNPEIRLTSFKIKNSQIGVYTRLKMLYLYQNLPKLSQI